MLLYGSEHCSHWDNSLTLLVLMNNSCPDLIGPFTISQRLSHQWQHCFTYWSGMIIIYTVQVLFSILMFTKLVAVFYLALNFCKHKHGLRFLYITKNCKLLTASWLWHPEFGWPLEIYWTGIRSAINGIVEISFTVVWRSHYWNSTAYIIHESDK